MDIQGIVAQLRQEASRLEQAIQALLGQPAPHRGRPPKAKQATQSSRRGPRKMSAAARAKIAAAQRARWAKQKRQAGEKKTRPAKKAVRRKPMSPAARKKLSALMKARWAEKKKQ